MAELSLSNGNSVGYVAKLAKLLRSYRLDIQLTSFISMETKKIFGNNNKIDFENMIKCSPSISATVLRDIMKKRHNGSKTLMYRWREMLIGDNLICSVDFSRKTLKTQNVDGSSFNNSLTVEDLMMLMILILNV